MESRGNYYSAERRNRVRSKDEVKTESVSARERGRSETSRPRVVAVYVRRFCRQDVLWGFRIRTHTRKRHIEPHVEPQMHTNYGYKESHYERMFYGNQKRNEEKSYLGSQIKT